MLFPPLNPPPVTWLDVVGNYFLAAASVVVTLFMLAYMLFFDWRRTASGKAIMYFVTGLVLWMGHTIMTRYTGGDWLFRDLLRALVYAYLLAVSAGLLINLFLIWRRGNHPSAGDGVVLPWRERVLTRRRDRAERELRRLRQDREPAAPR